MLWRKQQTCDHLTPLAVGGTNAWLNVVVSCGRCNGERGKLVTHYKDMLVVQGLMKRPNGHWAKPGTLARRVDKFNMRLGRDAALLAYWVRLETERLGWSPSAALRIAPVAASPLLLEKMGG